MQRKYVVLLLLRFCLFYSFSFIYAFQSDAQPAKDSILKVDGNYVTLSEVVIDKNLNVPAFISKVKSDTSFYKAFKNLRILGYTSINDIRMFDRKDRQRASLHSKTRQIREDNCRSMQVIEEESTGDIYDDDHRWNYYTAELYSSLFFTQQKVCGETNIIGDKGFDLSGKNGIDKHKEQLKMLFFNPGKKINGLPFMSGKTEIFDQYLSESYDMTLDYEDYNGRACYVFTQKVKPGREGDVVIDEMTTWFDAKNFDVVARNYSLSYEAGVYDFNVKMQVEMVNFNGMTVPSLIRYNGNWKAIFRKREHGVFTATLFDFKSN